MCLSVCPAGVTCDDIYKSMTVQYGDMPGGSLQIGDNSEVLGGVADEKRSERHRL
jgi:hypothetical protein